MGGYPRGAQRQRISLSQYAMNIIESDSIAFMDSPNISGFVNLVLRNIWQTSDASISLARKREYERLIDTLQKEQYMKQVPIDLQLAFYRPSAILIPDEVRIVDLLLSSFCRQLIQIITAFPKEVPLNIRLQNDVYDNLGLQDDRKWAESEYYKQHSDYVKALLEDYAHKSYYDREAIYFATDIDFVRRELLLPDREKRILSIEYKTANGDLRHYNCKPYGIAADDGRNFHYLVGMSVDEDSKGSDYVEAVFRISRIKRVSLRAKSFGSGKLKKYEQEALQQSIVRKGVQYLMAKEEEFKIRLTPTGIKWYGSFTYQRPVYRDKRPCSNGNTILVFDCTKAQIENYFFKFGKEAIIVAPIAMTTDFLSRYKMAYEEYEEARK